MRRDTGIAQSLGPLQRLSPSARQSAATLSPSQPCFGVRDLGRDPGLPLVALRGIGAQQGSVSRNPGLWPEKRKVESRVQRGS